MNFALKQFEEPLRLSRVLHVLRYIGDQHQSRQCFVR